MKKNVWIIVCISFLFTLYGCGGKDDRIMKEAVAYAEENMELLQACAQELQSLISEKADEGARTSVLAYKVELQDESRIRFYNYLEEREEPFESALCEKVLSGGIVQYISIHYYHGNCSIAFSCGGYGVGSNTGYYDIQIITSDKAEDLWGFDSEMTLVEQELGFLGHETEGDNTFFYYRIAKNVYYTEALY